MCTAIEEMGKDAAPWKKCHKHQLQQCSWYGGLHKTFREIVDKGFDTFKIKYAGSIFAITMRDPGDRLLSMAEMRLGTSRVSLKEKEEGYSGHTKGTNQTALQIFEHDVKENVGGTYINYLNDALNTSMYNFVCLLAHDGGFDTEKCVDSPEHLTKKLPKAIKALRSFHSVGLTDDFATSVLMAGLTAGWDRTSLLKHAKDRKEVIRLSEVTFEESKKEIPHRMCWENMHQENQDLFLQSRLFQAEIKLFQEAQRIHSMQLQWLSDIVGKEAFEAIMLEYKKKYDANSMVRSRNCKFTTMN